MVKFLSNLFENNMTAAAKDSGTSDDLQGKKPASNKKPPPTASPSKKKKLDSLMKDRQAKSRKLTETLTTTEKENRLQQRFRDMEKLSIPNIEYDICLIDDSDMSKAAATAWIQKRSGDCFLKHHVLQR